MQRQTINFEKLPPELILHCFSFMTNDVLDIIRLGLTSKQMFEVSKDNNFWKSLCLQHEVLNALIVRALGRKVLENDFNFRELFLLGFAKRDPQKIKELFKPYVNILVYSPSYEPNHREKSLFFRFENRALYLSTEIALKAIPNKNNIKKFLQITLPIDEVDFTRLNAGIVTYSDAIPDKAIISQSAITPQTSGSATPLR